MVIYHFLYTRTYDTYFELIDVFVVSFGVLIISLFFGFCLTMLIEVPFANLQKMMFDSLATGEKGKGESKSVMKQANPEKNHDGKAMKAFE